MSMDVDSQVDLARYTLRKLEYDKDRWQLTVTGGGVGNPPSICFFVYTNNRDEKTGLFSTNRRTIWPNEFPQVSTLSGVMQSLLDDMIREIEELQSSTTKELEKSAPA